MIPLQQTALCYTTILLHHTHSNNIEHNTPKKNDTNMNLNIQTTISKHKDSLALANTH